MANKYILSKIYRIYDVNYNMVYYGSTIESLATRMAKHRINYKRYKEGKTNYYYSFKIFNEYGVENCKIELVEYYPCNNIEELKQREGHYIENNECVNKLSLIHI